MNDDRKLQIIEFLFQDNEFFTILNCFENLKKLDDITFTNSDKFNLLYFKKDKLLEVFLKDAEFFFSMI